MVLVPAVVDEVGPDIPVLAAGGIGNGRQMAAAMALGAQGAWTGSLWLTVAEASTEPWVVENLLRAGYSDTVRSRAMTGKPARQIRTEWTEAWDGPDNPDPLPMPLQGIVYADAAARFMRARSSALSVPGGADHRVDQQSETFARGGPRHGRGIPGHSAALEGNQLRRNRCGHKQKRRAGHRHRPPMTRFARGWHCVAWPRFP